MTGEHGEHDTTRLFYGAPIELVRLNEDVPSCDLAASDEVVIDHEREPVAGDIIWTWSRRFRQQRVRKFHYSGVVVQIHHLTGESTATGPSYVREKLYPWPLKPQFRPVSTTSLPCPDCIDDEGRFKHDPQEVVCPGCENLGRISGPEAEPAPPHPEPEEDGEDEPLSAADELRSRLFLLTVVANSFTDNPPGFDMKLSELVGPELVAGWQRLINAVHDELMAEAEHLERAASDGGA